MKLRREPKKIEDDLGIPTVQDEYEDEDIEPKTDIEKVILSFVRSSTEAIEELTDLLKDDPHPKTGEAIARLIEVGSNAIEKLVSLEKIKAETRKTIASAEKIEKENRQEKSDVPALPGGVNINNAIFLGTMNDILKNKKMIEDGKTIDIQPEE
jgi:hypothetical protein